MSNFIIDVNSHCLWDETAELSEAAEIAGFDGI